MTRPRTRPLAEPTKGPGCDIPACLALGDSRSIRLLRALVYAADFTRSTTEAIRRESWLIFHAASEEWF